MVNNWLFALIGGLLIGLSASGMLLLHGRVTGISGILYEFLLAKKSEFHWRFFFLIGLIGGGLVLLKVNPKVFESSLSLSSVQIVVAGLLVGFGTVLGSGCTSGHGVCGISRMSIRSVLATLTFIAVGVVTVFVLRRLGLVQ